MVAVERIIRPGTTVIEASAVCPVCRGTGLVSYWNEISFFEDRRICTECDAGQKADAKMGEIIDRAMRQERIVRR
jgi:Zn ribbon nucleic-acid-binding protein